MRNAGDMAIRGTRQIRPLLAAAAAAAALVLVASCASGSGGSRQAQPTPSSTAHDHPGASQPPAAPLRAGERFVNLTMPESYTPAAPNGGTDEYRCFLIDPRLTRTAFLTGSQFLPQNSDIVHHAIFFRIDPADADAARRLDASTPGQGWTCFGNAGIGRGAGWVAAWAPGADETLLDPGLGYSMPPGSQLVMQVHYNLVGTGGKPGGADQSGIRLRLTDDVAHMTALQTVLVAAPVELPCAAGESGPLCDRSAAVADVAHRFGDDAGRTVTQLNALCNKGNPPVPAATQHCDRKLPQGGTIYDQAARPLAKPVTVKPGDTLRVTCTHDASLRKRLPQLQPLPPRYVVWGDGTSDEMCLGLVIMARG